MGLYTKLSDAEIADRLNLRDMDAFKEIYQRYWGVMFSHARKMLKDDDQAQDVVQDVFATMLAQMGELYYKSTIASYLYTSIRNLILDLIRHQKVKVDYISAFQEYYREGEYLTDNGIREKELQLEIEKEIQNLPAKMRAIFEMSRKSYMTHKEIAEAANISEGTVKKQLYYAIKILRSKLTSMFFLQIMALIVWLNRLIN